MSFIFVCNDLNRPGLNEFDENLKLSLAKPGESF